jgi:hypothetical protein
MPMTAAQAEKIGTALAEIEILKAELKRRSLIYQYEDKVAAAKHFGLTFEQVDIEFTEWMKIRARYFEEIYARTD